MPIGIQRGKVAVREALEIRVSTPCRASMIRPELASWRLARRRPATMKRSKSTHGIVKCAQMLGIFAAAGLSCSIALPQARAQADKRNLAVLRKARVLERRPGRAGRCAAAVETGQVRSAWSRNREVRGTSSSA